MHFLFKLFYLNEWVLQKKPPGSHFEVRGRECVSTLFYLDFTIFLKASLNSR